MILDTVGLISLALEEAPQVGALIAKLVNSGRTKATEEELADLDVSQDELAAAIRRLYPGVQLPDGRLDARGNVPGGIQAASADLAAEVARLQRLNDEKDARILALQAGEPDGGLGAEAPPPGA